ncbi:hypothetical protein OHA37_27175 [Streptomyces sp. NBC_00335]|uniref:hypothetical protein n=1 Tax=unclassified Streptomyces TaxID=2593676 RepID=UPI00224D2F89|nr:MULTISPECIES: hypothetical protein [unclassified Streptomyces]MCX5407533.1 hypothetical protein [Streptomyces sp. NBC_00086]
MSPTPPGRGPVRPLAEINREIRALVAAGRAGDVRYEELLAEWAAAIRADVRPAA